MNTYLGHQMRRAHRFVTTYQNSARIPETRTYSIQPLKDATIRLEDKLGRPPNILELSDELKWAPKKVETLQKELKAAIPLSHFGDMESGGMDPLSFTPSKQNETLRLLRYELSPEENSVFEYVYGFGGKPKLSPGDIAKKLNMSPPKVSRLKKLIADKYAKYNP
jgi:DNA-directed RNA polymerase sigma subunit (sigma70/sigma32)